MENKEILPCNLVLSLWKGILWVKGVKNSNNISTWTKLAGQIVMIISAAAVNKLAPAASVPIEKRGY